MPIFKKLDREVLYFIKTLTQSIMGVIFPYLIDWKYAPINWEIRKMFPNHFDGSQFIWLGSKKN